MSDEGFVQLGSGKHLVRIEGDLVVMQSRGLTTLDDLDALQELYQRVHAEHGSLFVLFDGRRGAGIDRPARKALLQPSATQARPNASAVFGASFASRTLFSMLERVLTSLGRQPFGIAMFATEQQARAYLDGERRRSPKRS